jgi:2-hydroxychromene-2-carboxylate isomerase
VWAKYFNVPITDQAPDGFPANTLHVMRTICALSRLASSPDGGPSQPAQQQAITKALDAFFDAYWVRNRNVADKEVVAEVLRGAGWDNKDVMARVSELTGGEGKALLAENTDRAFADGAFGLPWFACENDRGEKEGFWGVDHLGVVLDFLGLEKPAGRKEWRAML